MKSWNLLLYNRSLFFKLCCSLLFVLLLGAVSPLFAQESVFKHPITEKSLPPALTELSRQIGGFQSMRSDFVQTKKISVLKFPLITKGHFLYAVDYGVFWKINTPFEAEIVITSAGYFERKNGELLAATPAGAKPQIQSYLNAFLLLFSGKFEELQQLFSLSFLQSGNDWVVGLTPKGRLAKVIQNIQLSGSLAARVKNLSIKEVNGDFTKIQFHDTAYSTQSLSEADQKLFQ